MIIIFFIIIFSNFDVIEEFNLIEKYYVLIQFSFKENTSIYQSKFENRELISMIFLKDFIKFFSKIFILNVLIFKKELFLKKKDL